MNNTDERYTLTEQGQRALLAHVDAGNVWGINADLRDLWGRGLVELVIGPVVNRWTLTDAGRAALDGAA